MRKIKRLVAIFAVMFVSLLVSTITVVQAVGEPALAGDLKGGINISYTTTTDDILSWYRITPINDDWSGAVGISFRIRNNIVGGGGSPIHIGIDEKDSDHVELDYNGGANLVTFIPLSGTSSTAPLRNFDSSLMLPGSFDGYVYFPVTTFKFTRTNFGNSSFNLGSIYGIFVGVNTKYDAFSNFDIGDIEIVKGDNSVVNVMNMQTVQDNDLGSRYAKDYNGTYVNFSRLSGVDTVEVPVDYTKVDLNGDLSLGANVSYAANESDATFSVVKITPTVRDYSNGDALAIRIKNNTGINTPIDLSVHETSSEIFAIDKGKGTVYYLALDGTISSNVFRAWDSRLVVPASFDGYLIVPFATFKLTNAIVNDGLLDVSQVYAFFFGVSNYKSWDAFANYQVGDIELIKKDQTVSVVTNMAELDETAFNGVFVKDVNAGDITIARLPNLDNPPVAARIGDMKILESFTYESSADIVREYPVWSGGSQITNSLQDGAMKVEIGGVIPGNNIYGSIDIFPKTNVTDFTKWNDGGVNKDQKAQGITFWVKNLSPKEITINLEFEEKTGDFYERWNIKYGAMIMLHDTVTHGEFIVMAKPVFAIPVGFEGWVRIDFSQYWVPAWCVGGDLTLDLTQPITGFFLTTDTTKNEGLSYLIDNIGIYFNKTEVTSLFYTPTNSFMANMGE